MAVYVRHAKRDEEDESVFISMTDIMISLLFIVIILMAFFAMQMRTAEPEQTISLSIHEIEVGKRDVMISILSEENRRLRRDSSEGRATAAVRVAGQRELRRRDIRT